jgi:serine/threonine protein kinase
MAYRTGNWVEGEGLDTANARGPRPIPSVHTLVRDLLGALEHAHSRGMILRRIVPASLVVNLAGRGTVTDLRYASHTLPAIPPGEVPSGLAYMAPEVRGGHAGEPASDIFTAGAILYYAVTGHEPPLDLAGLQPPTKLRPACPKAIERVLLRALSADPEERYLTAAEMYEDFASDAGMFEAPAVSPTDTGVTRALTEDTGTWEKRLRRGRWATTTSSSAASGPAASAGCTGSATSTSSGRWRSRCCTRCSPRTPPSWSASGARRSSRRGSATRTS